MTACMFATADVRRPPYIPLQAFVLRRNAQLLRNDAAWALFWFM